MPKIEEVKQLIFRHFHEQGVEVCINRVARGLQVQFYPWPSGNKIGNAVIIGRSSASLPARLIGPAFLALSRGILRICITCGASEGRAWRRSWPRWINCGRSTSLARR